MLQNLQQFSAAFDDEANFCAGSTQIHTHSPTCVKYYQQTGEKQKSLQVQGSVEIGGEDGFC
jgi:hypothetical protein